MINATFNVWGKMMGSDNFTSVMFDLLAALHGGVMDVFCIHQPGYSARNEERLKYYRDARVHRLDFLSVASFVFTKHKRCAAKCRFNKLVNCQ